MPTKITGRCLCGAVEYQAEPVPDLAVKCFCADCRKSSGGAYVAHLGAVKSGTKITGEVVTYQHATDSGNQVTKAFCPTCGSQVYSTNSSRQDMLFLRASTLDDETAFTPRMSVYASRAPSWNPVDTDIPSFAEMPG